MALSSMSFGALCIAAGEEANSDPASLFTALKARLVGPALMSGRIGDFAVNPDHPEEFYAAACSGGVWKTVNAGITWTPVFDSEGSYSIGCLAMDPRNPNVVWVGTGENNSQRSVSFGDGVYRTRDGGKHWENLGLKDSEHIGMIKIDPRDSDLVYVAAQGPLWRSGGDRGLYRTPDGGKTWQRILHVSDDTGINEVHLDPRNPDVLYASAYQRRRHVWTLINGGPESGIYKSVDAGRTWRELTEGIPDVDKGRIGLAVSPVDPDVVYAIIEAAQGEGGFFRSTNRGETWEKRGDHMTTSPQYYNEIVADPVERDRVYALDTFTHVTEDGGASFSRVPIKNKHVDDHALWIDPANNRHLRIGSDGGIYETYDRGENWAYTENLPITQFYRINCDDSLPFYRVFGGTQDNASQGGPSRTTDRAGITSADWFVTVGGDGYETIVDPDDPNIIYSMWQYGGLVRYDHRSGEVVDIKPRAKPEEEPLKWNWDSPLIMSPHNTHRLYFAANRLYRSEDRGDSWTVISGDLTRGIDRNGLSVMGRIQAVDAVSKHKSTSMYGNAVALCESPLEAGLLYVGTDDGLIHVSPDGGESWRKLEFFPGVPDHTYVSCLTASRHDADTVYAAFDNHKKGDFKPYLLVSTDRGETWESMVGDLPNRETVYSIQQDHEDEELLFAGTEFGAWYTVNSGVAWHKVGGLPTIAVRDVEIQRRENDLILGTFGRSIYILDDYSPLRHDGDEALDDEAYVFPIKDALRYVERSRLGGRDGRGSQGATFYSAANPPFGAVITYHLKEKLKTRQERRRESEEEAGSELSFDAYPTAEELREEERESTPELWLVIRDDAGEVVRRIPGSRQKGIQRIAWDLRVPSMGPISLSSEVELAPWEDEPSGHLALPGDYTVALVKVVDGVSTEVAEPRTFKVVPLELATFAADDKAAAFAFQREVSGLQRAVEGTLKSASETRSRLNHIREAIRVTPRADAEMLVRVQKLSHRLDDLLVDLRGDPALSSRSEPQLPSISARIRNVVGSQWHVTSPPTATEREALRVAGEAFSKVLEDYRDLVESDLAAIEAELESVGAPWTPGRIPRWPVR